MAGSEDWEVEFEEGISWLPSYVRDEAIRDNKGEYVVNQKPYGHRNLQQKSPAKPNPQAQVFPQRSKSSSGPQNRKKNRTNWTSGGPGMQAIFLDNGKKSCGTGVFLPQGAGTNSQQSKKSVCSPVLLPARVVQALNLNVHAIGLQISPRQDAKNNSKGGDFKSSKNKKTKDLSAHRCFESQNEYLSPGIVLPKEWTY